MYKFHQGSRRILNLPGKSRERQGKANKNPRNSGSNFLILYFLYIFLSNYPAVVALMRFLKVELISENRPLCLPECRFNSYTEHFRVIRCLLFLGGRGGFACNVSANGHSELYRGSGTFLDSCSSIFVIKVLSGAGNM